MTEDKNTNALMQEFSRLMEHADTQKVMHAACGANKQLAEECSKRVWSLVKLNPKILRRAVAHFGDFLRTLVPFAPLGLDFTHDITVYPTKQEGDEGNFTAFYTAAGLRKLYHRSPRIQTRAPIIVREKDTLEIHYGTEHGNGLEAVVKYTPCLKGDPGEPEQGLISFAVDGLWDILLLTADEFKQAMAKSRAGGKGGPWEYNRTAMMKKTLYRRLDRLVPLETAIGLAELPEDSDMQAEREHDEGDPKDLAETWGKEKDAAPAEEAKPAKKAAKARKPAKKAAKKDAGDAITITGQEGVEAAESDLTPAPEAQAESAQESLDSIDF